MAAMRLMEALTVLRIHETSRFQPGIVNWSSLS
jgi:hypothetical protein